MTVGPVGRNAATGDFFDGTANGQFLIRRCVAGGHPLRPQARFCDVCRSTDLAWEPASGRARLVSWSVVPSRPIPGDDTPPPPPVIPAVAALEEGPWWWSMIVDANPDQLSEGLPLTIDFERAEGGEAVPVFRLAR